MNKNKKRTRKAKILRRAMTLGLYNPALVAPEPTKRKKTDAAAQPESIFSGKKITPAVLPSEIAPDAVVQDAEPFMELGDTPAPQFRLGQEIIIDAAACLPSPMGQGLASRYANHRAVIETTADIPGCYMVKSSRAKRPLMIHQKYLRHAPRKAEDAA
jgi:hypothetical protein